jgi:EmrB/QacA subfamily drug resistance transporter
VARTHEPEAIHARRWRILAVLNLSLVIVVAANSSLNVALPTIVRDLQATNAELQWIVDAYALVFAGLLLPMGALGDRFGRKGLLQGGLATFALGALAATLASEPWQVIATRAVMGVGAAAIMPATLSIITNVFPPDERSRAIAIWAGFAGAGGSIGPLASGFLLEHFWFGSVFFINVPIIALALVTGALLLPSSRDPEHRALDPVGSLLSIAGLGTLLYAIIQAPERGWADPLIVVLFAVAVVTLSAFVRFERAIATPMLPMDRFADPRFSVGSGAIFLTFFAMFGLFFVLTQYLQFVLSYSPLQAGAATLPMALSMIASAPRSAALADRFGRKRVMAAGMVLLAVAMVVLSILSTESSYPNLAVALVLLGSGMGLAMAPATGAIMESMPLGKAGVGSAVNDTTRELGGSLGVAVLGSLLSSGYRGGLGQASFTGELAALPPALAQTARESAGAALGIADRFSGPAGDVLASLARHSFTDAMGTVFLAAAAVAMVSAGLVLRFMPGRAPSSAAPATPSGDQGEAVPA